MKHKLSLLSALLFMSTMTISAFTSGPLRYTKLLTPMFHENEAEVYGPERPITGSIEIPYNVSTSTANWKVVGIRDYAFMDCKLTGVKFSPAMRSIGFQAFYNCTELRKVEAVRGLKFIEGGCFMNCRKLEEFQFPESIKLIGESAFKNCTMLKSAYFGEHVSSVRQQAFAHCSSLESVVMKCFIKEISDLCFTFCSRLKSIELPRTVRHIGQSAFEYSGLEVIHIGERIETIYSNAFVGTPLKEIYIKATTPPQAQYIIEHGRGRQIVLHVPATAVNAYRNHPYWREFNIKGDL